MNVDTNTQSLALKFVTYGMDIVNPYMGAQRK